MRASRTSPPRLRAAAVAVSAVTAVTVALALIAAATGLGTGPAAAYSGAPCFDKVGTYTGSGVPPGSGIPPWGFHTGDPLTGASGSYARAWGDINLAKSWISGKICQVDRSRGRPDREIVMAPEAHIVYHTHYGHMWGYPGNVIKVRVKVTWSSDPRCKVGTVGLMTMFGSYNNVRSDSVQFKFPAACRDHDHTYHGPQVNAQVPPL